VGNIFLYIPNLIGITYSRMCVVACSGIDKVR